MIHVAVLMGGWSSERDVSLVSGAGVADACEALGHRVTRIDMGRDVAIRLAEAGPDIVFNALHGTPGEDGTVQGMLDLMGLKYTHSGMATSVIAIDKELTKQALVPHGIRMPEGRIVASESLHTGDPLSRPYVLKPINEGSSVGVAIVTAEGNYGSPIGRDVEGPWQHFESLLAEPYIRGRELTVSVLGDRAFGITELKPKNGWYDYDAKYTDGLTTHICPAEDIPDDVARSMIKMSIDAHRILGCRGVSRSDFRWDDEQGEAGLYLLEVNTQPGMTPLSLVPEQARLIGLSYEGLVQAIIEGRIVSAKAIKRTPARRPAAKRPSSSISGQAMRALEAIGISRGVLRRVRNWTLALLLAAGIAIGIGAMGVPQTAGMALSHGIGRMGFIVRNIQIAGRNQVDRDMVYAIALETRGQDMPLVDLAKIRGQLLQLGWVGDARVSRRLPDTLLIDIVERQPAAILQRNQMLSLVDAEGHVLAPVDPQTMPVQLPLIIGNGVEAHVAELRQLIGAQPALKQLVAGGTWIGDRRWDLRFQSGEVLALPEGVALAREALARFVRKDSEARLLGQGYVRIDMRDPKQIVVRTSSEPGSRIGDAPSAAVVT